MKTVLITGANAGIGLQTAKYFLEKGHQVFLCDLQETINSELKESSATYYSCDVTDSVSLNNMFSSIFNRGVILEILINNAGILGPRVKAEAYPVSDFDKVINVNVKGVFMCLQAAVNHFIENKIKGSIVNVASVAGLVGMHSHIAYSTSKHAVIGMTKSAAVEYAKTGIRINAACPGFTDTNMLSETTDETYRETLKYATPMKRFGRTEEIAKAIYFLASEDSTFVTGHALAIDGGLIAQ